LDAVTKEAVEEARAARDARATARSLITRATVAPPTDAEALFREGAEIAADLGFSYQAEIAYANLAESEASKGRFTEALGWEDLVYRSAYERGDVYESAIALTEMCHLYTNLGRFDMAIDCGIRSVAGLRAGADPIDRSGSVSQLANAEAVAGDLPEARDHLAEAAGLIQGIDSTAVLMVFLDAAIDVIASDYPENAARALGAVDRWTEQSQFQRQSQRRLDDVAAEIETSVGRERFEQERRVGYETDPRELFDEIRADLAAPLG
jgi:tetratricopeptide (TPR) repeat protein